MSLGSVVSKPTMSMPASHTENSTSSGSIIDAKNTSSTVSSASSNDRAQALAEVMVSLSIDIAFSVLIYYASMCVVTQVQKANDPTKRNGSLTDNPFGMDKEDAGTWERIKNFFSQLSKPLSNQKPELDEYESERLQLNRHRYHVLSNLQTSHEVQIASDIISPQSITTTFADIGGIHHIKQELYDLVVLPLLRPDLFISPSGLVSPPRGILLYGQPGTGKTLLAKAIASTGHAAFLNVRLSTIMDKWFGESNKLIRAVFTLADRLSPSVIFIDELDTFLKSRDNDDQNGALGSMKNEFLTLWDGITTVEHGDVCNAHVSKMVVVLGATNRPQDVDEAVLRRLPRTFEIGLPDAMGRKQILELMLRNTTLTSSATKFVKEQLCHDAYTAGYSGSDLKELCRVAAMEPVRELTRQYTRKATIDDEIPGSEDELDEEEEEHNEPPKDAYIRPIKEHDFQTALRRVRRTGEAAYSYQQTETRRARNTSKHQPEITPAMAQHIISLLAGNSNDRKQDSHLNEDSIDMAQGMQFLEQMMTLMKSKQDPPPPKTLSQNDPINQDENNTNDRSNEGNHTNDDEPMDDVPNINPQH